MKSSKKCELDTTLDESNSAMSFPSSNILTATNKRVQEYAFDDLKPKQNIAGRYKVQIQGALLRWSTTG